VGRGQTARNLTYDPSQRRNKRVRTVELVNVCIFVTFLDIDMTEDDAAMSLIESCQCTAAAG
jgi:hypothetical protein